MSRTYRLRHLPSLPGTAKKFTDSRVRAYHRQTESKYWKKLAHEIFDYPCVEGKGSSFHSYWGRHYNCIPYKALEYTERQHLFKMLENGHIYAVGSIYEHPWVGWGVAQNPMKNYYKQTGARNARRTTRQKLNHNSYDPDTDFLPTCNDTWSSWDLW